MSAIPITDERIARLRTFGLSEYAARAYLALLDLGLTEARDISTLSKVPTSKIYRILEQLHEKGLAIILPEFPKKYAPVPFDEYLDTLQEQHEDALRALERDREDLTEIFSVSGDVDVGDRGSFTVTRGRRNVLAKIQELVSEARYEILFLGTRGTPNRSKYYFDEMRRAHERNVRLRLLLPEASGETPEVRALEDIAEIREQDGTHADEGENVAIGIFDNASAFIVNFVPDDGHLYQGKDTAFFTDHEAMVQALKTILEPHWVRASRYRDAGDGSGAPREFTRFFVNESSALAALADRVDSGVKEIRSGNRFPERTPSRLTSTVVERLRARGGRFRALMNVSDVDAAAAYERFVTDHGNGEMRHGEVAGPTRFWIVDDEEAFFTLVPHDPGSGFLMVHTSNPEAVQALSEQFDATWDVADPLPTRREALAALGGTAGTQAIPAPEAAGVASEAVVAGAEREVRVIASRDGLARFAGAEGAEAAARGVKARILATVTAADREAATRAAEHAEVRHMPNTGFLGASRDRLEAVMILPQQDGKGGTAGAYRTTDPMTVAALDGLFDAQWSQATPLSTHLAALDAEADGTAKRMVPEAAGDETASLRKPGGRPK